MARHCGAKLRNKDAYCQQSPLKGSKRCRLHGGLNTIANRGNKDTVSPGDIYSKYLTPEERVVYDKMEVGTVDAELKVMKIRLVRALKLEQAQLAEADPTLEIEGRIERDGGGPNTVGEERSYKKRDYHELVRQTAVRIESLERTRIELAKQPTGEEDAPTSVSFTFEVVDGRKTKEEE